MKKRDVILIIGIILISLAVLGINRIFIMKDGSYLKISVNNQIYGYYDLSENRKISIADTNICEITDRSVKMVYGDCPDLVCVHSLPISVTGQTIICMPNKVVLEIVEQDTNQDHIDTIVE